MRILITTIIHNGIIGEGFSGNIGDMLGIIALIILIAPAVALFIYFGSIKESFPILLKLMIFKRNKARNKAS